MKKFIKMNLRLFCLIYLILGLYSVTFAATTCNERYLNSLGQCAINCATLGKDYQPDDSTGLCEKGKVCCHQTAATQGVAQSLELQIPLFDYAQAANLPEYILTIYRYALITIVPIAIIMIIVGGIMWISAAGNQGSIKKAKKFIIDSMIGLCIALFSYIFLSLIGITTLQMPGLQSIARLEAAALEIYEQSGGNYTTAPGGGGGSEAVIDPNAPKNIVTIECDTLSGTKKLQVDQSIAEKVKKTCLDLKNAGFNIVKISGYRVQDSGCHPKGLALDINENNNGCFNCYGKKGSTIPAGATFNTGTDPLAFTEKTINIIKNNGWCWGGDWGDRKDMHHVSSKSPMCSSGECAARRPYNWSQSFEKNLNP